MTAPIRSMPDLIAGLRASVVQRGVAFETVDNISGLPDRYTSKLLAPNPIKNLGFLSIEGVLGALGKALVLVDDPEQIERVKGRWKPSKRPMKLALQASASSIDQQREKTLQHMRKLGSMGGKIGGPKGGKRRAKLLGKRARQRIATHAARMRWAKNQPS